MTIIDNLSFLVSAQHARRPLRQYLHHGRRLIDSLVAAIIAWRQRQADLALLKQLSHRELKDIGLFASQIDYGLDEAARMRTQRQLENAASLKAPTPR